MTCIQHAELPRGLGVHLPGVLVPGSCWLQHEAVWADVRKRKRGSIGQKHRNQSQTMGKLVENRRVVQTISHIEYELSADAPGDFALEKKQLLRSLGASKRCDRIKIKRCNSQLPIQTKAFPVKPFKITRTVYSQRHVVVINCVCVVCSHVGFNTMHVKVIFPTYTLRVTLEEFVMCSSVCWCLPFFGGCFPLW